MKIGDTIYFIDNNQNRDSVPRVQKADVEKILPIGQIMVGWRECNTHMATVIFPDGENWQWFTDSSKAEKALRPLPKCTKGTPLWTLNTKNEPTKLSFAYLAVGRRNFIIRCTDSANKNLDFELRDLRKTLFSSAEKADLASRQAKFKSRIPFLSVKTR